MAKPDRPSLEGLPSEDAVLQALNITKSVLIFNFAISEVVNNPSLSPSIFSGTVVRIAGSAKPSISPTTKA